MLPSDPVPRIGQSPGLMAPAEHDGLKASVRIMRSMIPPALHGKPLRKATWLAQPVLYRHTQRLGVVLGHHKAGTTWFWNMLAGVRPYRKWTPPGISHTGLNAESEDDRASLDAVARRVHALRPGDLTHTPPGFTITRLHTHPTPENIVEVAASARPFVVLIRDPRDMAVSWAHFAAHNELARLGRSDIAGISVRERLDVYTEQLLDYALDWGVGWLEFAERSPRSLVVRYEDLLADTPGQMRRVANHLGMRVGDQELARIIESNSFERTTGRPRGAEAAGAHNRKGVIGDWKTLFDEPLRARWRARGADRLARLGYAITELSHP